MNAIPLPTTLILLSELPTTPPHSKVRFLGCVTKYTVSTATLALQHSFQLSSSSKRSRETVVTALVDVSLLLEGLKITDTQVGAWVNVIGYIGSVLPERGGRGTGNRREESTAEVKVQAIMVWYAGAIATDEYESALLRRKIICDHKGRDCP